jgi:hypothetical protein
MQNCSRLILSVAVITAVLFSFSGRAEARARPSFFDVVIEGGAVQPLSDLKAGFETPSGFEASTGFEIGVRFRQHFRSGWAIAPSFHYVQFGKYLGEDEEIGIFETGASMYRYGVDLQYFFGGPRQTPRFFLTGGSALVRDRMREDYLDDGSFFESVGVNSLALSAGAGMQVGSFEFVAQYHHNHFTTRRFYDGIEPYEWDYISLRVGITLPSTFETRR